MRRILALASIVALAGCGTPYPQAVNRPASSQYVLQAAKHWDLLAGDVTDRLLTDDGKRPAACPWTSPVAIEYQGAPTPFSYAFREMLITQMFNKGCRITEGNAPQKLAVSAQVVRHFDRLPGDTGPLYAVSLGLLTGSVAEAFRAWPAPAAVLGAAGLVSMSYVAANTNTEIIVTTTGLNGDQMIFRDTAIYYINDLDTSNYVSMSVDDAKDKFAIVLPTGQYTADPVFGPKLSDADVAANYYCSSRARLPMFLGIVPVEHVGTVINYMCRQPTAG